MPKCMWDNVEFVPLKKGQKFCSPECEQLAEQRPYSYRSTDGPEGVFDVVDHGEPHFRLRNVTLDQQERRKRKREPGARRLELAMRTTDEASYRPPRRLKWIGINLAVPEKT